MHKMLGSKHGGSPNQLANRVKMWNPTTTMIIDLVLCTFGFTVKLKWMKISDMDFNELLKKSCNISCSLGDLIPFSISIFLCIS